MKTVFINFDGIHFKCVIELNQLDNIDQGFNVFHVKLESDTSANFQHILDQEQLIKLIYEQLKSL